MKMISDRLAENPKAKYEPFDFKAKSSQAFIKGVCSAYGGILTKNTDLVAFSKFIVNKDESKRFRLNPLHHSNSGKADGYYNPTSVYVGSVNGWEKMSEETKLSVLRLKFSLSEILSDWLCVLPTLRYLKSEVGLDSDKIASLLEIGSLAEISASLDILGESFRGITIVVR